jgi:hypothetical protein
MATNVMLWLQFENVYQPALSIPVDECRVYSFRPLSWLRYLGFTIYGSQGHISTSAGGLEVDYHQDTIQAGNYYYVSELGDCFGPSASKHIHLRC